MSTKKETVAVERDYDDFAIVCPSKGRAGNIPTLQFIPNLTLVVPSYQLDEYKEKHPGVEILSPPDHCDNIAKTRQWMLEKWPNIFMIDDDVIQVVKNFANRGEERFIKDPVRVREIIRDAFYIADQIGAKTYGFRSIRNPLEFSGHRLWKMTGYLNNSYVGFIEGHNLEYDLSYGEAEDYYITCEAILHHRYTFIEQRYSFVTKDNFLAAGGVNDLRTIEMMKENTLRLRKQYGEVVVPKKPGTVKGHVHEGERSLVFPY